MHHVRLCFCVARITKEAHKNPYWWKTLYRCTICSAAFSRPGELKVLIDQDIVYGNPTKNLIIVLKVGVLRNGLITSSNMYTICTMSNYLALNNWLCIYYVLCFHWLPSPMYLIACSSYSDHRSQLYCSDGMTTNCTPRNMYLCVVCLLIQFGK